MNCTKVIGSFVTFGQHTCFCSRAGMIAKYNRDKTSCSKWSPHAWLMPEDVQLVCIGYELSMHPTRMSTPRAVTSCCCWTMLKEKSGSWVCEVGLCWNLPRCPLEIWDMGLADEEVSCKYAHGTRWRCVRTGAMRISPLTCERRTAGPSLCDLLRTVGFSPDFISPVTPASSRMLLFISRWSPSTCILLARRSALRFIRLMYPLDGGK
jgi:hypothetical protein